MNTPFADAIILACGKPRDTMLAQLGIDGAMMPMADKTMLQRVVEKLVSMGCRSIAVVHGDHPRHAQALLADGARWGCRITHHHAAGDDKPLHLLQTLISATARHQVLATADSMPIDELSLEAPCVAFAKPHAGGQSIDPRWSGWAVLPGEQLLALAQSVQTAADLNQRVTTFAERSPAMILETPCLSSSSVAAALASLPMLFTGTLGPAAISRRSHAASLWIGNGSRIHPSARLRVPLYIGNNVLVGRDAEIGPDSVIGDGCIVDAGSRVEGSILLPNTYVGRKLDVSRALLAGNQLANDRLGVAVRITDREFLRDINAAGRLRAGLSRWLARILAPLASMLRARNTADAAAAASGALRKPFS